MRDDFIAVAGHELRTPLIAARLTLDSLMRAHFEEPRQQEQVLRINRQLVRLTDFVTQLLDV